MEPTSTNRKTTTGIVTDELMEDICRQLAIKTSMSREVLLVMLENLQVFDTKQQDYSSNNITAFGEKGVVVRCNDKIERLKNLVWDSQEAKHEAVADTWMDLSNYALIGYLCNKGLWK